MRALVITAPGGPEVLALREVAAPTPGRGELRVRVRAAGLNRADVLQRRGLYPAPPWAPQEIPGLEYAGEVDAVGEGVQGWQVGDRAMGIVAGGGCAEQVVVHADEALPAPAGMPWEEAAAIPEAFATAYDAIWAQGALALGEWLLIHAVGSGVGTAALQLGRLAGARVIGTSRTAQKLSRCAALGLEHGVLAPEGRFLEGVRAVAPEGVDVIADFLGASALAQNLEALRPQGRVVVIGLLGGAQASLPMGLLLQKRLRVMGTVLRARPLEEKIALAKALRTRVLPHLSSGALRAVVERVYPMEEAAQAHRDLEANQSFGKLVLRW
jgi:putative PIG3 family NAD(P)H quinone oxidoreductase